MGKQRDQQKGPDNRKNDKANIYLNPATGSYSVIDLSLCDPTIYMDYSWKVHDDTCGSDHFPIIMSSTGPRLDEKIPRWKLGKANWVQFQRQWESEYQKQIIKTKIT